MASIWTSNSLMTIAEDVCKRRLDTTHGQVWSVFCEFAETEAARLADEGETERFEHRIERAADFIDGLRGALNQAYAPWYEGPPKDELANRLQSEFGITEPASVIWPFPDATRAHYHRQGATHDWPHDQPGLASSAIAYLSDFWGASAAVERILIAALAYSETNAFSQIVRSTRFRGLLGTPTQVEAALPRMAIWRATKSFFWLLVAIALGLIVAESYDLAAGLLAFALLSSVLGISRFLNARELDRAMTTESQLIGAMLPITKATRMVNFAPTSIRSALESSTTMGAVWPNELWQLVLRAEDRCRWQVK